MLSLAFIYASQHGRLAGLEQLCATLGKGVKNIPKTGIIAQYLHDAPENVCYSHYMRMDLFTLAEAADRARLSVRTLRAVLARGDGPEITRLTGPRGKMLIPAASLENWIKSRTKGHADHA